MEAAIQPDFFSTCPFESDTSDVRRRGLNETLESAAMRNIQTLAATLAYAPLILVASVKLSSEIIFVKMSEK